MYRAPLGADIAPTLSFFEGFPLVPPPGEMLWNGSQPVFSHLLKNVLPHMGVYCGKRVVEKVEVFVGVHSPGEWSNTQDGCTDVSPGQVYPLLLAAAQVNSLFANLGAIATSQLSQVGLQSACLQHLGKKLHTLILCSWKYLFIQLVTERLVKHDVLLQSLVSDPCLLSHKSNLSSHICNPPSTTHLAKQCREEGRLSGTHLGGQSG